MECTLRLSLSLVFIFISRLLQRSLAYASRLLGVCGIRIILFIRCLFCLFSLFSSVLVCVYARHLAVVKTIFNCVQYRLRRALVIIFYKIQRSRTIDTSFTHFIVRMTLWQLIVSIFVFLFLRLLTMSNLRQLHKMIICISSHEPFNGNSNGMETQPRDTAAQNDLMFSLYDVHWMWYLSNYPQPLTRVKPTKIKTRQNHKRNDDLN